MAKELFRVFFDLHGQELFAVVEAEDLLDAANKGKDIIKEALILNRIEAVKLEPSGGKRGVAIDRGFSN